MTWYWNFSDDMVSDLLSKIKILENILTLMFYSVIYMVACYLNLLK